jgi:hypothetical protein
MSARISVLAGVSGVPGSRCRAQIFRSWPTLLNRQVGPSCTSRSTMKPRPRWTEIRPAAVAHVQPLVAVPNPAAIEMAVSSTGVRCRRPTPPWTRSKATAVLSGSRIGHQETRHQCRCTKNKTPSHCRSLAVTVRFHRCGYTSSQALMRRFAGPPRGSRSRHRLEEDEDTFDSTGTPQERHDSPIHDSPIRIPVDIGAIIPRICYTPRRYRFVLRLPQTG